MYKNRHLANPFQYKNKHHTNPFQCTRTDQLVLTRFWWIAHTTAFVTSVVEHWLEREIAQWVHHEGSIRQSIAPWAMLLPRSYISLLASRSTLYQNCYKSNFIGLVIKTHSTKRLMSLLYIVDRPSWPCHTVAYERSVRVVYEIFTHTVTYARGKLGIGCIRFKHAGIR